MRCRRKGGGEALTGVRAGRTLSRENTQSGRPRRWSDAEGNTGQAALARRVRVPRGRRPRACTETLSHGNREVPRVPPGRRMAAREGLGRQGGDERPWEVGRAHSTGKPRTKVAVRRDLRRGWREGARPRGTRVEQTSPGPRSRSGMSTGAGTGAAGSREGQEGAVHDALAPRLRRRAPAGGLLRPQAEGRHRGWTA